MKKWKIGIILIGVLLTACANTNNEMETNKTEETTNIAQEVSITAEDVARINSLFFVNEDIIPTESQEKMKESYMGTAAKATEKPIVSATVATSTDKATAKPTISAESNKKAEEVKDKEAEVSPTPIPVEAAVPTVSPTISTNFAGQDSVNELLALMNAERTARGVGPLAIVNEISLVAQARTLEIETCFSHQRPDGTLGYVLVDNAGIAYTAHAENIAGGYNTAQEVHSAWMASAQHAAAITDALYTRVGIACHTGNDGKKYWVQIFLN